MRCQFLIFAAFLLSACVGNPQRPADTASYDLGPVADAGRVPALPLAGVEVRAAPWLDTQAQLYRLGYSDDLRRRAYAGSRWVASPAQLFERYLQRRIAHAQADSSGHGCRLALMLDELEQRFDTEQSSQAVLDVRVRLLPARGETALAVRVFSIRQPAATPDARGGVAAVRDGVRILADELVEWLEEAVRQRPQIAAQCKQTGEGSK